tara:strand:+ start:525 stop:626 length:102 start_codon:yes stop_codon:yes gene_type:complete
MVVVEVDVEIHPLDLVVTVAVQMVVLVTMRPLG